VLAVRPRADTAGAFPLRGHELLGWLTLAAAVLHVGLLLAADQRVIEHIKLTAPPYEYAGILALLSLLFLTVPAGAAVRWPASSRSSVCFFLPCRPAQRCAGDFGHAIGTFRRRTSVRPACWW
jgi:hypothetical protein